MGFNSAIREEMNQASIIQDASRRQEDFVFPEYCPGCGKALNGSTCKGDLCVGREAEYAEIFRAEAEFKNLPLIKAGETCDRQGMEGRIQTLRKAAFEKTTQLWLKK